MVVSDRVTLPPLEILEETSVSSVLVEATVQDKEGRYISWLEKGDFSIAEDGVAQAIDLVQLQDIPTTFTLLIDSSQSLNRRMEMVKAAARRLATELRKGDRVIVAPFRTTVESTTGPTDDGRDHRRGDRRHPVARRHRDPRRAVDACRRCSARSRAAMSSSC